MRISDWSSDVCSSDLKAAVSAAGWQADYQLAQNRLRASYPIMTADAILWRTTFLDLLLGWEEFRARHQNDGELPTASMLKVAATIPTYGDDTSFDIDLFEEELENRSEEHTYELQSLMRNTYAV